MPEQPTAGRCWRTVLSEAQTEYWALIREACA